MGGSVGMGVYLKIQINRKMIEKYEKYIEVISFLGIYKVLYHAKYNLKLST